MSKIEATRIKFKGTAWYERYYLREDGGPKREVTQGEFIAAERAAAFYPSPGEGPVATDGFGATFPDGREIEGFVEFCYWEGSEDPDREVLLRRLTVALAEVAGLKKDDRGVYIDTTNWVVPASHAALEVLGEFLGKDWGSWPDTPLNPVSEL